jgi:hypothetical protein
VRVEVVVGVVVVGVVVVGVVVVGVVVVVVGVASVGVASVGVASVGEASDANVVKLRVLFVASLGFTAFKSPPPSTYRFQHFSPDVSHISNPL